MSKSIPVTPAPEKNEGGWKKSFQTGGETIESRNNPSQVTGKKPIGNDWQKLVQAGAGSERDSRSNDI